MKELKGEVFSFEQQENVCEEVDLRTLECGVDTGAA